MIKVKPKSRIPGGLPQQDPAHVLAVDVGEQARGWGDPGDREHSGQPVRRRDRGVLDGIA